MMKERILPSAIAWAIGLLIWGTILFPLARFLVRAVQLTNLSPWLAVLFFIAMGLVPFVIGLAIIRHGSGFIANRLGMETREIKNNTADKLQNKQMQDI